MAFALSLPKNSNERKNKWNELLKKGDFNHNIGVLKTNSGFIIPCKRPSKDVDACKFLPCPLFRKDNCLGRLVHPYHCSHPHGDAAYMYIKES